MTPYSKELIERTTGYFAGKNHPIDEEKAIEYLDSVGNLYSSFLTFAAYDAPVQ